MKCTNNCSIVLSICIKQVVYQSNVFINVMKLPKILWIIYVNENEKLLISFVRIVIECEHVHYNHMQLLFRAI